MLILPTVLTVIVLLAGMYTIEFQKRGLPHAHILVWLSSGNKLKTGADIDKIISSELPDNTLYPRPYDVVSSYMMHGHVVVHVPSRLAWTGADVRNIIRRILKELRR